MKIRSKDLVTLTECSKKYALEKLSLKSQNERNLCFYLAIQKLAEGLAERKETEKISQEVLAYLKNAYQETWFPLSWQKGRTVELDMALIQRFLDNFVLPNEDRIYANQQFEIPMPLECNEVEAGSIIGKADLLIEHADGRVSGIILYKKFKKPYSYYARKHENKVMNSIELLALLEGLMKKYPGKEVCVSMVRLSSPSDKPNQLAPFENKKGENIISFTNQEYVSTHPEGVCAGILDCITNADLCSCKDCSFDDVCKPSNRIYVKQEAEAAPERKELVFSGLQKKIINHRQGPIRVCAGPGSGKTAVLVERIRQLIRSGVPADKVLAITFTKKAAQEMQERIHLEDQPEISTLHALAFRILTQCDYVLGTVRLAGKVDCMNLLLKILNHAPIITGVSYEGLTMRYGLISTLLHDFEFINNNGLESFAETYSKKDISGILKVKEIYDVTFREKGYITFDDQITMAVKLLKEYPGILETVQDRYDFILVDEVQDLDAEQAEFVRMIARAPVNNLMICGDADQSIYSFRGGSNQFMLDFLKYYPDTEDVHLGNNYRSSKEIVDTAFKLIQNNKKRVPMELHAAFSTGFQAICIQNFNDHKLLQLIRDVRNKGYQYDDIAVIATKNKTLLNLCEAADREMSRTGISIPMERPKFYFRDDYIFQMLLDILDLKTNGMHQDRALYRLLAGMGCNVKKSDRNLSLYEDHIKEGRIYRFDGEEASRYFIREDDPLKAAYAVIFHGLQKLDLPIKQALCKLTESFFPNDLCIADVIEKVEDMIYERKITNYVELYELLSAVKMFEDDTRLQYPSGDRNRVHMLTAHDAKGKEFPVVIIYGVDDFERGDTEEDRRLLYVALTRAKRVLFLTESFPEKSRFLKEIEDCITRSRSERYE